MARAPVQFTSFNNSSSNVFFITAMVIIATWSLWVRASFPMLAISDAGFDDALFVRLARSLRSGHWLGDYDSLILAKGMFYPLFIAFAHTLHIPLKIAEHLTYLVAAAGCALLLRQWSRSNAICVVLFALLAFNPAIWGISFARVIRECLYISLSLTLLIVSGAAVLHPFSSFNRRLCVGVGAGLIGGMFWLTREEGLWILPALGVLLIAGVLYVYLDVQHSARKRALGEIAATAVAGLLTASMIVAAVSAINYRQYGVFTDVEFKAPGFLSAYGAISRIKPEVYRPKIILPQDVREKLYAVGPAAAQLRAGLDGENGDTWRRGGCAASRYPSVDKADCPEILSGWFMWALRDAASLAGHYTSAREAEKYYTELAKEINDACALGELDCFAPRHTLRPPLRWEDIKNAFATMIPMTAQLISSDTEIVPYTSKGDPTLYPFLEFTRTDQEKVLAARTLPYHPVALMVGKAYRVIASAFVITGLIGLFYAAWTFRRHPHLAFPIGLAAAAVTAIISRIALLSYLDVTSMPSMTVLYLSPATPFVFVAGVVGTWVGWNAYRPPIAKPHRGDWPILPFLDARNRTPLDAMRFGRVRYASALKLRPIMERKEAGTHEEAKSDNVIPPDRLT